VQCWTRTKIPSNAVHQYESTIPFLRHADHDKLEHDVMKRQKEALFETGAAETFNVCEWGGIDRLERGAGRGKIAVLRPAIAAQAIVSFEPQLQSPLDLAGVAIGINDFTGSHYTTIGLLEGAIAARAVCSICLIICMLPILLLMAYGAGRGNTSGSGTDHSNPKQVA
jgi:hypothetical protein